MKILLFISVIFFISILNAQVKIFDENSFKIYVEEKVIIYGAPNRFTIYNNTNENYIINTKGFIGSSLIYNNGERLLPNRPGLSGYPFNWNSKECKENILIIPKKNKVNSILYLNIIRDFYSLNSTNYYEIKFNTEHTKQSPYYFGCKKYVDSLISKGYKIFEGKLIGEFKLITNNYHFVNPKRIEKDQ